MDELDNRVKRTEIRHRDRYESMIFNNQTTALTDYRSGRIRGSKAVTQYKEKPPHVKPCKEPLKVTQTLTEWKEGKVPFDLFLKPKEIVQTDPRIIQESHILADDLEREEVRKTRPRVVLTPAAAIDDVGERERKLILEDMYLSTTHQQMRAGTAQLSKPVVAPLVPMPAPTVPIKLEKYMPHVVPPEWRMESASWDGRQLRAYCDPTKEFWLRLREKQSKGKGLI